MSLLELDASRKSPVPPASPPPTDSWARAGRRSRLRGGGSESESEEEYLARCLLMLSRGERGGGGRAAKRARAAAAADSKQGYECSVCGKVYAPYQALGGHKTSHRKPPTPPATGAEEAPAGSGGEGTKVHQCSLCLRTFPSGQALGGHKRLHYEGGAAAEGVVKVKTKAAEETALLKDFDLNLPAEPMGDEAESAAKRARMVILAL